MSAPMEAAKSNIEQAAEQTTDEGVKERLSKAAKIISQNRNKIWLRTKTGKPIAEKAETITAKLLTYTEDSASPEFNAAVVEVEDVAKTIAEESRRRSMVVT